MFAIIAVSMLLFPKYLIVWLSKKHSDTQRKRTAKGTKKKTNTTLQYSMKQNKTKQKKNIIN